MLFNVLFTVVALTPVAVLMFLRDRDRGELKALRSELDRKQSDLFEAALFLRAAKNAGQRLDPYTDTLVKRTLAICPKSSSGTHQRSPYGFGAGTCQLCGLSLT